MTSTAIVPRIKLIGWKRAAESTPDPPTSGEPRGISRTRRHGTDDAVQYSMKSESTRKSTPAAIREAAPAGRARSHRRRSTRRVADLKKRWRRARKADAEHPGEHRHEEPVTTSVTSSRFCHTACRIAGPELTEPPNTTASTKVIGNTFSMVWPSISATSHGRPTSHSSSRELSEGTPWRLRSREPRRRQNRSAYRPSAIDTEPLLRQPGRHGICI